MEAKSSGLYVFMISCLGFVDSYKALARTVYAREDIVLLDDTFSALDSATEEAIIERLLGRTGLFRKLQTTIVLVGHACREYHPMFWLLKHVADHFKGDHLHWQTRL